MSNVEKENAKEKNQRQLDKYEMSKSSYADSEWKEHHSKLKRLRVRYSLFILICLIAFTAMFFINDILSWFNFSLTIENWLKYLSAGVLFIAPFIRSFFGHQKVLTSYKLWSAKLKKIMKKIENWSP